MNKKHLFRIEFRQKHKTQENRNIDKKGKQLHKRIVIQSVQSECVDNDHDGGIKPHLITEFLQIYFAIQKHIHQADLECSAENLPQVI
ncbi:hypothetical protein SDC9_146238 [bioreactor metagenome]|uniref:Uncharacterized protein n=1 Tax=bioreactor metagenome TaxID=1076179 RepID=A0A645ED71_9ZZZZ